jgi:hypothetical protein
MGQEGVKTIGGPFEIPLATSKHQEIEEIFLELSPTDYARVTVTQPNKGTLLPEVRMVGEGGISENAVTFVIRNNQLVPVAVQPWRCDGAEWRIIGTIKLLGVELQSDKLNPLVLRVFGKDPHKQRGKPTKFLYISGKGRVKFDNKVVELPINIPQRNSEMALLKQLNSADFLSRAKAAWALSRIDKKKYVNKILPLIDDKNWYVRRFAVVSMTSVKDKIVISKIVMYSSMTQTARYDGLLRLHFKVLIRLMSKMPCLKPLMKRIAGL